MKGADISDAKARLGFLLVSTYTFLPNIRKVSQVWTLAEGEERTWCESHSVSLPQVLAAATGHRGWAVWVL